MFIYLHISRKQDVRIITIRHPYLPLSLYSLVFIVLYIRIITNMITTTNISVELKAYIKYKSINAK